MYKKVNVEFALNKIFKKDKLFFGDYTIDPYQNCEFACSYCDSSFDKTIFIKENLIKILDKEISKIPKYSKIIIGSVHDPYQEIEKKEKKTRGILKKIIKNNHNCHILTKSDLVLRDLDLLKKIKNCFVTISITSLDINNQNIFERNLISTKKRFNLVNFLSKNKIYSGIALMPYLPYIVDDEINDMIRYSKENNAKYFLYKFLELKGDQKLHFFNILKRNYKELIDVYEKLYKDSFYPKKNYRKKIELEINKILKKHKISKKIKN